MEWRKYWDARTGDLLEGESVMFEWGCESKLDIDGGTSDHLDYVILSSHSR